MLYMIYGEGAPDSRPAAQHPAQSERLRELGDAGRLVLAGPLPAVDGGDPGPAGMVGGLIVAEFESLDAARTWIEADPRVQEGSYVRLTVTPFKQVLCA